MSKIITAGIYCMVSIVDADITTVFNNSNVAVVYDVNNSLSSWIPGREINNFDTLVKGRGYYVVSKASIDLTGVFVGVDDIGSASGRIAIINNSSEDLTLDFINQDDQSINTLTVNARVPNQDPSSFAFIVSGYTTTERIDLSTSKSVNNGKKLRVLQTVIATDPAALNDYKTVTDAAGVQSVSPINIPDGNVMVVFVEDAPLENKFYFYNQLAQNIQVMDSGQLSANLLFTVAPGELKVLGAGDNPGKSLFGFRNKATGSWHLLYFDVVPDATLLDDGGLNYPVISNSSILSLNIENLKDHSSWVSFK